MKRIIVLILACVLLASYAWAVEEIRPLGMSSATGGYSGDLRVGNTCTTSPQGKYYCGVNARHIYFFTDNTVSVDDLYPLAAGDTGFPYVLGGTWTVDSAATYRGRLGTGTPSASTYLRGDGSWGTPASTTTTLPWDNITSTPTTLAGYGITDYAVPIAYPWDNITRTLSSGVTDTELSYLDNVTSAIQTQFDTKQAYHANLATFSALDQWRLLYSNGSSQTSQLAFGTDNQCLISTGQYSTPEWGACGTGSGDYDADNVAITGGTIDNTVIGGGTSAAGTFSSLTRGTVSNTEFGYLDGVTSAIQTQFNLKRALDNVTFTSMGVATFDNEVVGTQFTSTGADNTHYIHVGNSAAPFTCEDTVEKRGACYYDNGVSSWLCCNGTSWAGPSATTIGSGNPTVDEAGEIGIDTTADQLVYFGTAERVITYQHPKDFVIYGYSASYDNVVKWKANTNQTLIQLDCITGGADGVTVTLYECDSNAANCVTTGLVVAATSTNASDSSASNGSIDENDWVVASLSSLTGSPTSIACSVRYVITRQ
jgi:hypothetical protein